MSADSEPRPKPSNITRLLYKAVKSLPEEEQAAVFQYFFELGVGVPRPTLVGPMHPAVLGIGRPQGDSATAFYPAQKGAGPNQQIIPVRLSEESHRRLKQWCADHDFHMSVVVRGLIERFLDGWQEPGSGGTTTAES